MKLKVLFVDDDENILSGFRSMLHLMRKEWECRFFSSADGALELVKNEPFDVVISDMRMPGMDGADFLREVERLQPGAVRMILSGYSEMQALLKSVRHAHQFISKPCPSKTIIEAIRRVADLRDILTNDSIRTAVTQLDSLPAIPEILLQIRNELDSPDPDLRRVAQLIQQDVGLSATLMKVVNSSFFGFFGKVASPARAVLLLGVDTLKGLVLGVHFLSELDFEGLGGYSVKNLWSHSLHTGYYAKVIAAAETSDEAFIDNCFVAGFLHDIGKLVLLTLMGDQYLPVLESAHDQGVHPVALEKRAIGVTHAEIGAYLLGLWGFNKDVVRSVYDHHSPARCSDALCPADIVHVADALDHEFAPQGANEADSLVDMARLDALGLQDRLEHWRNECRGDFEDDDA